MAQRNFDGVPSRIDGDRLLTASEAAELLGVDENTIRRRMDSRDIAYLRYTVKGGKRAAVRFRESDVVAYKNRCYVPARKAS